MIFEIGTVFRQGDPVEEREKVAFAVSGPAGEGWADDVRPLDVLDAKGMLEAICSDVCVRGVTLGGSLGGPFHPGRSAAVLLAGDRIGVIGELHPNVAEALEINGRVAVAELEVAALRGASEEAFVIREVPRYPPVRRDLAFVVPDDVAAGDVQRALMEAAGALLSRCVLFDVFQGGTLPAGRKSLAFALEFRSPDRTLTGDETDPLVRAVADRLGADFDAELRAG
jgi:phenylalanyl-tRNA synthetase beta chain